ncbi:glycerate kinase [Beijerinckia sp. L45]|uniref:glycerate kinase type-2 family protein n=1 Tax=Beijerinckia sp. L45 TaxID=1641855 RepID=UPI00131A998F|nr:glycerate kinase [Beijerinckia sp. L45]
MDPKTFLRALFDAAVAAADPMKTIAPLLPSPPKGRTLVIGAGKASAEMARALEAHWAGGPLSGLVVTRYGHGAETQHIEIVEASHPVPDQAGADAAVRMLELVKGLTADDLVIALISGGGSSLLPMPFPPLTLADKQAVNKALLKSGATITEMNCVRRHLSGIKGGRLLAACAPAKVVTLSISDVPGDAPGDIASGPTVPDATSCADALAIIAKFAIEIPDAVRTVLTSGAGETPKPGDASLPPYEFHLIAAPQASLEAAADLARKNGITPYILGDSLEGESRDMGVVMAGIARQVATRGQPFATPCVLLSGGESTVTVRGNGRGGRNVEFLLALAVALQGNLKIHALAGDTDGVDGAEEIAGAYVGPETIAKAWAKGINPAESLAANDGHGFFQAIGDSVVTGPTLTNVNDFRAILIL